MPREEWDGELMEGELDFCGWLVGKGGAATGVECGGGGPRPVPRY